MKKALPEREAPFLRTALPRCDLTQGRKERTAPTARGDFLL